MTRLKVAGFKSFAQSVDLPVQSGITAVVGPNGCGKSNLLEALCWVMGESSAKRLRGKEMNDVIFSGNENETQKRSCEVELHFDPHFPKFSKKWEHTDVCIIKRRLVQDEGSTYSINGRTCRARDIQIFFADMGAGSSSHAFVGQGQVTQLIEQSPVQRRHLLEEAAGASGLQVRRRESLNKLSTSETNLTNLKEILRIETERYETLSEQSEKADIYRRLSGEIDAMQTQLLYQQWKKASEKSHRDSLQIGAFQSQIEAIEGECAQHQKDLMALDQTRYQLNEAQLKSEHKVRLQEIEVTQLKTRRESRAQRKQDLGRQITILEEDIGQCFERIKELKVQQSAHQQQGQNLRHRQDEGTGEKLKQDCHTAEQAFNEALDRRRHAQEELQTWLVAAREVRSAYQRAQEEKEQEERRFDSLQDDLERIQEQMEGKKSNLNVLEEEYDGLKKQSELLIKDEEQQSTKVQQAQRHLQQAQDELVTARQETQRIAQTYDNKSKMIEAESKGYRRFIEESRAKDGRDTVDRHLEVPREYAPALAMALGHDRFASNESRDESGDESGDETRHLWRTIPQEQSRYDSADQTLWNKIKALPCMESRLSRVRLVESKREGMERQSELQPGESLASSDGWFFGWDGVVCHISHQSRRTQSLDAELKLKELKQSLAQVEEEKQTRKVAHQALQARKEKALDEAKVLWKESKRQHDIFAQRAQEQEKKLKGLQAQISHNENVLSLLEDRSYQRDKEVHTKEKQIAARASALETQEAEQKKHDTEVQVKQAALREKEEREEKIRERLMACEVALERYEESRQQAEQVLQSWQEKEAMLSGEQERVEKQIDSYKQRLADNRESLGAEDHHGDDLEEREDALQRMKKEREVLSNQIKVCDERREENQREHSQKQEKLRYLGADLARITESHRSSKEKATGLEQEIRDRTSLSAEEYVIRDEKHEKLSATQLTLRLKSATEERDALGAVNLLAAQEAEDLKGAIEEKHEHVQDLEGAIDKLRKGIANIDSEARVRILEALKMLEQEYVALYRRLFRGGKARLALQEEEDFWNVGLEIYAAPPGKKLRSLSLLSGGEQTLTALALLLSVYRLSQVPFCVLDEVDAALDDNNTARLVNVINELFAEKEGNCCLVVTHNRLTMNRVDRLIGVTMPRPGSSQIVSVNLQQAEAFAEA